MKRSRFAKDQTTGIPEKHEAGVPVANLCRKHGVSDATVCKESRAAVPARSSCHGLLLARRIMLLLRGKFTYPGCSGFRSQICK